MKYAEHKDIKNKIHQKLTNDHSEQLLLLNFLSVNIESKNLVNKGKAIAMPFYKQISRITLLNPKNG